MNVGDDDDDTDNMEEVVDITLWESAVGGGWFCFWTCVMCGKESFRVLFGDDGLVAVVVDFIGSRWSV